MNTQRQILDFYTRPGRMTSLGRHAALLDELPFDLAALVEVIHGLVVHEYLAEHYGAELSEGRKAESHLRSVEQMLDHLLARDAQPLSVARRVDARLVGVCHHFALLLVAMLRAKGVAARARCGFGAYFNPGYFEDHWVCEYWNTDKGHWVLVDAQLDEVQRQVLKIHFDPLDVPRDCFVMAGEAWAQSRAGAADPAKYGIFRGDQRGLWFIAGNVVRDVAALDKMEMLPWDQWGVMPRSDQPLSDGQLAFFDRLAELTRAPDTSFSNLRRLYESDWRLQVPGKVGNALRNRSEAVFA